MSAPGWTAIAIGRTIGRRPKRIVIDDIPHVLFRAGSALQCLVDRCPHRHAPLSMGRVVEGTIECPYHGWRFDGSGLCRAMPGLCDADPPRIVVPARRVVEAGGIVFLAEGDPAELPYVSALAEAERFDVVTENVVAAGLVDVAENVLDATHTHFTHKGLLRGLSKRRNRIEVTITRTPTTVEACYRGEARQDGAISRLLEGGRTTSVGRFIAPGIAELAFYGPNGPNLVTTFHLRAEAPDLTRGIAILAGPRQGFWGLLKAALFLPLFKIAYLQDKRILGACAINRRRFGDPAAVLSPIDVLRADIAILAAGGRLTPGTQVMTMAL